MLLPVCNVVSRTFVRLIEYQRLTSHFEHDLLSLKRSRAAVSIIPSLECALSYQRRADTDGGGSPALFSSHPDTFEQIRSLDSAGTADPVNPSDCSSVTMLLRRLTCPKKQREKARNP